MVKPPWCTRGILSWKKYVWSYKGLHYFVFIKKHFLWFFWQALMESIWTARKQIPFIYLRLNKTNLFCSWVTLTCLQWELSCFFLKWLCSLSKWGFTAEPGYSTVREHLPKEKNAFLHLSIPATFTFSPFLLSILYISTFPLSLISLLSLLLGPGIFFSFPLSKDYSTISTSNQLLRNNCPLIPFWCCKETF